MTEQHEVVDEVVGVVHDEMSILWKAIEVHPVDHLAMSQLPRLSAKS